MAHRLTVDIPDEVYESLVETARKAGRRPETLAAQWLKTATQHLHDDTLERFIGAFSGPVADWADNHDRYIGEDIMRTVRDASDSGQDG